jgi:enamine deaminase RidA (YjgF/YER057c/UK114 family)
MVDGRSDPAPGLKEAEHMTPKERLVSLGLVLSKLSASVANYVPYRWAGDIIYLSGVGSKRAGSTYRQACLGRDASFEDGYADARLTGLNLLAVAQSALGRLDRMRQRSNCLAWSMLSRISRTKVINGCSDLLVEVLGVPGVMRASPSAWVRCRTHDG